MSAFRLDARLHATLRPVLQTASGNAHDGHRHAREHPGSISSRSSGINDISTAYASFWPVYAASPPGSCNRRISGPTRRHFRQAAYHPDCSPGRRDGRTVVTPIRLPTFFRQSVTSPERYRNWNCLRHDALSIVATVHARRRPDIDRDLCGARPESGGAPRLCQGGWLCGRQWPARLHLRRQYVRRRRPPTTRWTATRS